MTDQQDWERFVEAVAWAIMHSMYSDISECQFKRYLADLKREPELCQGTVADDGMKAARAAIAVVAYRLAALTKPEDAE